MHTAQNYTLSKTKQYYSVVNGNATETFKVEI